MTKIITNSGYDHQQKLLQLMERYEHNVFEFGITFSYNFNLSFSIDSRTLHELGIQGLQYIDSLWVENGGPMKPGAAGQLSILILLRPRGHIQVFLPQLLVYGSIQNGFGLRLVLNPMTCS